MVSRAACRNLIAFGIGVSVFACAAGERAPKGVPGGVVSRDDQPVGVKGRVGVPVDELGEKYDLLGRTGQPLGKVIRVEGVVVQGPYKGFEGGVNLLARRINGRATQERVRVPLHTEFRDPETGDSIPDAKVVGKSFAFEGYESGEFVGTPVEVMQLPDWVPVQTTGFYFRSAFYAHRNKPIDPVRFTPADFVDREALMEGTAVTDRGRAYLTGDGWRIQSKADGPWPQWMEGKPAATLGVIRRGRDDRSFGVDAARSWPVNLEDQLGRRVELRGRAVSLNGHWWFVYRGRPLYVEGMDKLPGWSADNHWRPMVVRGTLDRAKRPDLGQITLKTTPDLKEYFVVHDPSWEPLDRLLTPEEPTDPE